MAFNENYDPREAIRYVDEFMSAFRSRNIESMRWLIEGHPGIVEHHAVEEILPLAYNALANANTDYKKLLYDAVIISNLDNKKEHLRAFESLDMVHRFNKEFEEEISLAERKMRGFKRR